MGPDSLGQSIRRVLVTLCVLTALPLGTAADGATDEGQAKRTGGPALQEERSFTTDFGTLSECIERVARDRGLTIGYAGGGMQSHARLDLLLGQRFAVVVDKPLFPFLKDGPIRRIGGLGRWRDGPILTLRRITIDPDTGALSGPEGVDLTSLKVRDFRLHLSATSPKGTESFEFDVCRDFAEKLIKVRLRGGRKDGQAPGHGFLDDLESKMKLASRLKAERKSRQAGQDRGDSR